MNVILLIGRIGCGKTTYARSLPGTLLLSCDALMQTLYPAGCGEQHDELAARARAYLFRMAREAAASGVTPVLDFGFWSKDMRREAIMALSGLTLDWRYLNPPQDEWLRRIRTRNDDILGGTADPSAYYVDEGLLDKCRKLFVPPTAQELPGLVEIN